MYEGLYSEPLVLIFAYMLDMAIGDPRWLPHPVRVMGWEITKMERLLRGRTDYISQDADNLHPLEKGRAEKIRGIFLVVIIVGSTYMGFYIINTLLTHHPSPITSLFLVYLTSTTIATHELIKSARRVINSLKDNDIDNARRDLSHIVGRDTEGLDKDGILRATIETVAENTSDGIIAPLFYFAIGGLPLAMAYKAINTLDSMVGYKNERYKDFGWASARLDDIANYIPARITGGIIVFATFIDSFFMGCREIVEDLLLKGKAPLRRFIIGITLFIYDLLVLVLKVFRLAMLYSQRAFYTMLKEGRRHPSPNSGIPEAAIAGALGLQLGGPSYYGGVLVEKPYIGEDWVAQRGYSLKAAEEALNITMVASFLGLITSLCIIYIRGLL
ncbi:MAG: adenosylcobinamide-phosphate synthase CbiB [Thermodesulfovibrionia bacterium]